MYPLCKTMTNLVNVPISKTAHVTFQADGEGGWAEISEY